MARQKDKKPRNVVKSRSSPSMLGGFSSALKQEALPSNRFIELGDIALGNEGDRKIFTHPMDADPPRAHEPLLMDGDEPATVLQPSVSKPPKLNLPRPQLGKPPSRPKSAPYTRPKPPGAPRSHRPKPPQRDLPPKAVVPKPPKVHRPKPKAGTAIKKRRSR